MKLRVPFDVIGTTDPIAPAGYACDGCAEAHMPMCGDLRWAHVRLEREVNPDGPCGAEIRYVHVCGACRGDTHAVLDQLTEPVEPVRVLKLVEG